MAESSEVSALVLCNAYMFISAQSVCIFSYVSGRAAA